MGKFPKALVCLLLCCSLLCGCTMELDPIVVNEMDLTMTLPGYFEDMSENATVDVEGFFAYQYSEIMITGLRDDYSVFEEIPTLEEYATQLIANSSEMISSEVEIIDGLTTFTYRQLENSDSYTCITAVFAGTEAFWMVTACCKTVNFKSAKDKLVEILKTTVVA
jgi:hypothetical protein